MTQEYMHHGPGKPSWPVRTADALAVALVVFGESVGAVLPRTWDIAWFSPLFLAGVIILIARHAWCFSPTIFHRMSGAFHGAATVAPDVANLSRIASLSRVLVLAAGLLSATLFGYADPSSPRLVDNELWNLPARWDAFWYLDIARKGYEWKPAAEGQQHRIAFFPLYPFAMRIGGDLVAVPAKILRDPGLFGTGDTRVLWGGVLVSCLCFVVAVRRVYWLSRDILGDDGAFRTSILLITYPFALFFSAAYSEGLFLVALTSTLLAWGRGKTSGAFLWGVVTGLSRSNGWAASIALAVDALINRRGFRALIASSGPVVGMGLFCGYTYWLTGSPLTWMRAQAAWGWSLDPWYFFTRRLDAISDWGVIGYFRHDPVDGLTGVVVLLALSMAALLLIRRQWLLGILILAYLTPAIAIDLPASGRMTAVLFPVFIGLASVLTNKFLFWTTSSLFVLGQLWLTTRFFTWQTPY